MVSVIVPVFNRERFVKQAIDSVLAQTFHDWELVAVDDGSTDASLAILKSYADPRIRVLSQTKQGMGAARNRGILATSRPLVAFLDSDDYWFPHKLQTDVDALRDESAGIAFSRAALIDEDGRALGRRAGYVPRVADAKALLRRNFIVSGSVPTIRRQALEDVAIREGDRVQYYDERYRYVEDLELYLRLATQTRWKFVGTAQCLSAYRVNATAQSENTRLMRETMDRLVAEAMPRVEPTLRPYLPLAKLNLDFYLARRASLQGERRQARQLLASALSLGARTVSRTPLRLLYTLAVVLLFHLLPPWLVRDGLRAVGRAVGRRKADG